MELKLNPDSVVVFDLDDTLYKEIDYVSSAYRAISQRLMIKTGKDISSEMFSMYGDGLDVFSEIKAKYDFSESIEELVKTYRFHAPTIDVNPDAMCLIKNLKELNLKLGLLTDGRSISQRNKLAAMGISSLFDEILISEEFGSEKPCEDNYLFFQNKFSANDCLYIGDNFSKDFVTPNRLGWKTIGLIDDGRNIHSQVGDFGDDFLPQKTIEDFSEVKPSI